MTTRTHFTHRIDRWDDPGESILEHLAGVEDYEIAKATYPAPVKRWPGTRVTMRAGAIKTPNTKTRRS